MCIIITNLFDFGNRMEKETVRRFDGRCINSEFWVHTFTKKEYRILNREKEIEAYLKGKLPDEEKAKYEIAQELGLLDKVLGGGWKTLTAKETGRIGGLMARKKK